MKLKVMNQAYSVIKLPPDAAIPSCVLNSQFVTISRTEDELSVVLLDEVLKKNEKDFADADVYGGLVGLKVLGPLDFSLIGILSKLTTIFADASISVFAISTYDTDYIFIRKEHLDKAIEALKAHHIGCE